MEIELTRISSEADIYDVRKAVATVLHGPDPLPTRTIEREQRGVSAKFLR